MMMGIEMGSGSRIRREEEVLRRCCVESWVVQREVF